MKIQTGQGSIPLLTVLAIWSISAITALPGLAVTPILGDLHNIFKDVSALDVQMISSMPNLFIIPFVLLSGKISESKDKTKVLCIGLIIFALSGILYLFSNSILSLILISCLLGIGAGMVTPLSTGFIADLFIGKYRTKQMGLSSGINNLTLVIATTLTGWLATENWHLPFIVYLIPLIALALSHFLSNSYLTKNKVKNLSNMNEKADMQIASPYVKPGHNINGKLLTGLMSVYFIITYIIILVSYNLSFILDKHNISSVESGWLISILFLAITFPGFFINPIVKGLKNNTIYLSFAFIAIGFLLILLCPFIAAIAAGIFLIGFGYGIVQPLIYDKTSLSTNPKKAIFGLACVMSVNYLAIYLCPFIATFCQFIFDKKDNMEFPFWINMIMAVIMFIISFTFRSKILFSGESTTNSTSEN